MQKDAPSKALLQNMLEEVMIWHASMLHSLLERQKHPDVIMARRLSDLNKYEWQRQRRQRKEKVKQRMDRGAALMEQLNSRKRKFYDMTATEQQILEDFETKKSRKMYEATCANKPPHFRGRML